MRQVARNVALENSRLRSLLASRGVTTEEVNHYLAIFEDQTSESLPTTASLLAPQTNKAGTLPLPPNRSGSSRPERDVPKGASAPALDTLAIVADASTWQTCCGPATQCSPADGRDGQGSVAEPSRGRPSSPPLSPNTPNATSHLEMSCTAAAQIMANMYRDGNKELAREALGCSGSEECMVKNTLVFQLLDSAETG